MCVIAFDYDCVCLSQSAEEFVRKLLSSLVEVRR